MIKAEQIKALENGKGVQYLLDQAFRILGNPIVMFDTNYKLKAYTDVTTDDPIWNEIVSTGTFSMKTQKFFAEEFFTEQVANANKIVVLKSSKLKYDRVTGHVLNADQIKVANLVLVASNGAIGPEDTAAFEELCGKFDDEIRTDMYYTEYGRAYHEAIIVELLDGIINDPVVFNGHVQIFCEGFEDYLYVAVLDILQNDQKKHQNAIVEFKNRLGSKLQPFKYALYSGYIVMVMSSKFKDSYGDLFPGNGSGLFSQDRLFMGISSSFENPYELREYYNQALAALKKGIESGQQFFFHDKNT